MQELTKNERIKTELDRISVFFKDIAGNQRAIISPLLQNAAFMKITLEDLQDHINRDGVVEQYQNGEHQHGMKQSAALQSYNSIIKNYASVIKQLAQLLPPERKAALSFQSFTPREKSAEEIEEELRLSEERTRKINEEIQRAAEYQQRQREQASGS